MTREQPGFFPAAWLAAAYLFLATAPATAQTIVHSFDGDHGPGRAVCETGVSHCGFPDMNMAVNGKQVVQVTWQNVNVYDYSGKLLKSTPMKAFISNAGLDPTPAVRSKAPGPHLPGPIEPH